MRSLLAVGPGVEKSQHLPARICDLKQALHHRRYQWFGKIVKRGPQQNHVKHAAGKIERLGEKALDIPDRVAVLIRARLPVPRVGIVDHIGHENAMAQASQVVDVGRRGIAYVDCVEAGLLLKPLAQSHPSARVARHLGPGKAGNGSGRTALLLLVKPTAKHPQFPLRSSR